MVDSRVSTYIYRWTQLLREPLTTSGMKGFKNIMNYKRKCAMMTPMFTAALFTIAKTWKQPKCPSTDEWIKKMWYIYKWNITQPQKRVK